ncbi:MAG: hypothetical protein HY700_17595 [Gemmatimonadetes bacterium]|nr:hypothetical protein [Gemmatimonadota bacterium]
MRSLRIASLVFLVAASALAAQKPKSQPQVQLGGTWKAETPEGPRSVIIRSDSSASYGDETVRWRLQGDSIHIAFGDEWMVYRYQLKGKRLTLSGGDLEEPITLKRTGPATPLPKGVEVPAAPPADRRGTSVPAGTSGAKPSKPQATPPRTGG